MLKCPVCPVADVPDEAQQCHGCGTDLSPIQKVRELAKAQFNAAVSLAESGDTEAAVNRVLAALTIDERFVTARKLAGRLLWQCGRHEEAVQQWRKALALTPEDQELAEMLDMACRERLKARSKVAACVSAALLVMVLCALGMYLPLRSVGNRLDGLEEETVVARAYRDTHSRPDSDYVALRADMGLARQTAETVSREFSQYRESYSHRDTDYLAQVQKAAAFEQQVGTAQASLAAEQDLREQIKARDKLMQQRLDTLTKQQEGFSAALGKAITSVEDQSAAWAKLVAERDPREQIAAQGKVMEQRLNALGKQQEATAATLAKAITSWEERSATWVKLLAERDPREQIIAQGKTIERRLDASAKQQEAIATTLAKATKSLEEQSAIVARHRVLLEALVPTQRSSVLRELKVWAAKVQSLWEWLQKSLEADSKGTTGSHAIDKAPTRPRTDDRRGTP